MIYAIIVNHELDFTEIRLRELASVVDVFIIQESNYSNYGKVKQLEFLSEMIKDENADEGENEGDDEGEREDEGEHEDEDENEGDIQARGDEREERGRGQLSRKLYISNLQRGGDDNHYKRKRKRMRSFLSEFRHKIVYSIRDHFPAGAEKNGWIIDDYQRTFLGKEAARLIQRTKPNDLFLIRFKCIFGCGHATL